MWHGRALAPGSRRSAGPHAAGWKVAWDAVVAKDAEGKAKMMTKTRATSSGALIGGFLGCLFGILFLSPVGGTILGGIERSAQGHRR